MASPPRGAIVATHSPDGPREFWLCRIDGAAARGRLKATWLERKGSTGATYELGGAQQGGIEQSSVVCEVERGWAGGATFRLTAAHRRTINAALNSAEDAAGSADDDEEEAAPEEQQGFEVETIVGRRAKAGVVEYRVKWRGFPSSDNSWEPADNLTACKAAIDRFNKEEIDKTRQRQAQRSAAPKAAAPASSSASASAAPAAAPSDSDSDSDSGKSAYELAREQKIRENEAMLKQLGLFEDAANMRAAVHTPKRPSTPRKRKMRDPDAPVRRSSRARKAVGLSPLPDDWRDDDDEGPGRAAQRRLAAGKVDESVLSAAEQTAGECAGSTFTKVMTPSMVEYSYKFGIGAAGAAVLPKYGSSPGGSRKMTVWMVADVESFGSAAVGSEDMQWPTVYHDHSKNFDGGWMGFAKAHALRTNDVCVFERLPDKFEPERGDSGFSADSLHKGWVTLRVTLHRSGAA